MEGNSSVWKGYQDCVVETAEEICGKKRGKCRHGETWWWKEEVKEAIDKKKAAFKCMKADGNDETKEMYKIAKKEAKKAVAKAKSEATMEMMNDFHGKQGLNKLYKVAKQRSREQKDIVGMKCIKDDQGKLCFDEGKMAEVWRKHMVGVMNVENERDGTAEAMMVEGPVNCFTEEEVKNAIKDLKYGKAGGISGVVAEHIRGSSDVGVEVLTKICNDMLDEGEMPEEWRNSILVPLYKGKGDVKECGSYRGVKLLEHGMKVVERVVERRLRDMVTINEMQCGFMPGRGTVDALYMVRMLQEKYARKKKKLYMCFVDLEKAFDRVPRKVIEWALRKKGVEERMVKMVMEMYRGAKTRVRIGSTLSDGFDVDVGVHQGSILSPFLFISVMDVVCGSVMEGLLFEILYADDLVLMAEDMSELQTKYNNWKEAMEGKGLKVNVGKTKCMISGEASRKEVSKIDPCSECGGRVGRNSVLCVTCGLWVHKRCSGVTKSLEKVSGTFKCKKCVGGKNDVAEEVEEMGDGVEKVESFVYLGDCLSVDGGCRKAITTRVRAGWKKFKDLSSILCGKGWSLRMKGILYSTCVRTVMTYGGETWTMRKEDENVLIRTERKMIRMMCGVNLLNKKNSESLRELMKIELDVSELLRRSRLRWYGHVMRREADAGIKRALEFEVEGRLARGRPRMGWKDLVRRDMEGCRMEDDDCADRGKWRSGLRRVGRKIAYPH